MGKRAFRKRPGAAPRYPTAESFGQQRRAFLAQLGAGLLGAVVASTEAPDALGNNGRKAPADKKKGKKKQSKKNQSKKKPGKKKKPNKRARKKPPTVMLGLFSSGPRAPIDM